MTAVTVGSCSDRSVSHRRYPWEYRSLITSIKGRVEAMRKSHAVQQYSGGPASHGPVKIGATFNYFYMDGDAQAGIFTGVGRKREGL